MKLISEVAEFSKMPGIAIAKKIRAQGKAAKVMGKVGKENPFKVPSRFMKGVKTRTPGAGKNLPDGLTNVMMRKRAGLSK